MKVQVLLIPLIPLIDGMSVGLRSVTYWNLCQRSGNRASLLLFVQFQLKRIQRQEWALYSFGSNAGNFSAFSHL